ncbi:Zn-ribbon domain-containing OB-fold protein [Vineibacter terrae]|uniref:Zn-ribbon domain-containing OB-fold protein n=1 Tax=Vineibacter terrae TaxID=2586908 RepID=UPI002E355F8A|nr:OB-fold domain-containing protein [Vineibacter terrae]HEX2891796.1 OB-fold domain-containing protein [Vineibacter terrae]
MSDAPSTLAPEFAGFFAALQERALAFPCCDACGHFHWYPMKACPHCRSSAISWRRIAGTGSLYSWTTVRHAFDPAWRDRLPYIVALVEFPDAPGVRLIANVAADPEALAIGMAVTPRFDDGVATGKSGVTFVPAGNA